jgi:hypothetical protein
MIMKTRMIIALLAITTLVVLTVHPEDVSELRAGGQLAVDDLHAKWTAAAPAERVELQKTLDKVCAQKDCYASRLYWYTDLDQAKEAARRTGRPILSLHLLGRLDEELSCANSRLFRTLLYSDDAIATILRDQYVLHWHSVREVPRVTIELGNGRVIRQTITGNSAHYLLAADGAPLDVLPGLYSPTAFREQLERWVSFYRTLTDQNRAARLRWYHQERYLALIEQAEEMGLDRSIYEGQLPVWIAQRQSQSKARIEVPMLKQLRPGSVEGNARKMAQTAVMLGERGKDAVQFSASTLQLMSTKQELTETLMDNLRRSVAADTALNEFDLHRRAHGWFADGQVRDLYSLNERVYDELFLTPSSDPWLGLQPDAVFTGIEETTRIVQPAINVNKSAGAS